MRHARLMELAAASLVLTCAACSSEPDFDERYEEAETQIRSKSSEIEAELRDGLEEESEPDDGGGT